MPNEPEIQTSSLPLTQLVRPLLSRAKRDEWPLVPDTDIVGYQHIRVGCVVSYRTVFGPKQRRIRVISRTRSNRRFFVGDSRKGWCRPVLFERIIGVKPWPTSR